MDSMFWDCSVRVEGNSVTVNRIAFGCSEFTSTTFSTRAFISEKRRGVFFGKKGPRLFSGSMGQLRALRYVISLGDGIYQFIRNDQWHIYTGDILLFKIPLDPYYTPMHEHEDPDPNLYVDHEFCGNSITEYVANATTWYDVHRTTLCTREDVQNYCANTGACETALLLHLGLKP